MKQGMVFDIARGSFADGPGIRTVVFFKGCNLKCQWCHNPESQSAARQILFYENKCIGCGICRSVCHLKGESCDLCGTCIQHCQTGARQFCGKLLSVEDVMAEIQKDELFFEKSGGGVTFSGGECMLQTDFLLEILKRCKENGIHTAIDTAGHIPYERFERVLSFTDLFLYDVKVFNLQKHKEYVGVSNELILNNLKRLFEVGATIWIRIPIIPTVNDSVEEMESIKRYISECGVPEKIELLPYHKMGETKCKALGKHPYIFQTIDPEKMQMLKEIFS